MRLFSSRNFPIESTFLSFHTACFEVSIEVPECPEKSEKSDDLQFHTIVWKEAHKREKSERERESPSTAGSSREDRPDDPSARTDTSFCTQYLTLSEEESLVYHSDDKEWKEYDDEGTEGDIGICIESTIVPKHDFCIGKSPPE